MRYLGIFFGTVFLFHEGPPGCGVRDWAVSQKTDAEPFGDLLGELPVRNIYARANVALFPIFNLRILDMRRTHFLYSYHK